ncbi:hypothetical protein J4G48_0046530 [Bradyrhizobium barranii subsp. apii]|uniref:HTH domain-containing protein n=1 Tax=Bradyrhizobium barranii TaxID=2992140 RepID=UPI001AA1BCE3|nr:hypothetical protein [Bradyrhizobium barranii]UPT96388.1 hypothetical protein J4G48_0046530 [Bradyrhizobium barranii subsp. apii]
MLSLFAWSLYWLGDLKRASENLHKLNQKRDDENGRSLTLNLAIASGDWNSLNILVETEWDRRENRTPEELLRAGQLAQQLGSSRAKQLVQEAAAKGREDAAILSGSYSAAVAGGWEDSPDVHQWLATAAALSGADGPVQQVSIKDVMDRQPDWQRRETNLWEMLQKGEAPILRAHPPYWRRLAAVAHASLLERELLRRGADISDFSSWAYPNRNQHCVLQNSVDLRREPRWLPEFLAPDQLKAEFVGRISAAMIVNKSKIRSPELRSLALDESGPLQSLIVFPAPYLPGPLEGGVEAVQPMPPDIERQVYADLKSDVVTPQSFIGLVNTALIFKLGPQMADLAAEALRRAKYQLRDVGADVPALSLLYGLAIVAAVTRSGGLAAEVRVLVRVARRRPGVVMDLSGTLRVVMMAAAAHADIDEWCTFVGDWLTELAYEDMTRPDARALSSRIRALCQIERRLWGTCARADAACASLLAA